MSEDILDWLGQRETKAERDSIAAFKSALIRQREAFEKNSFSRRSWVKEAQNGAFQVKFGKLEKTYTFADKNEVLVGFQKVLEASSDHEAFRSLVEEAYSKDGATASVAETKPKAKGTGKLGRPKKDA
ncbi:hypothetical protein NOI24_21335 [Neorhizobium galegae]|uniref:hypothetical protein n=1 Tax=Neorhizobium galegae TaxID=399 RepID=UPI002103C156|nr:hypothetical protein [Neorhizobium galegae]MCQ1773861.1 hypothetical protein [Neorhizobium galegae]MCQ1799672.1 hypothetical protein [Neorhizobium galegae]